MMMFLAGFVCGIAALLGLGAVLAIGDDDPHWDADINTTYRDIL
jgi:hypothetical protein